MQTTALLLKADEKPAIFVVVVLEPVVPVVSIETMSHPKLSLRSGEIIPRLLLLTRLPKEPITHPDFGVGREDLFDPGASFTIT